LRQQSSQLLKVPFASSLHWKLCYLTSSGICPFLGSRVTQRVTQNSALFWLGADCVALFVRCLGRGRFGELLEARIDEAGNIIGTHVCCNLRKNSGGWNYENIKIRVVGSRSVCHYRIDCTAASR